MSLRACNDFLFRNKQNTDAVVTACEQNVSTQSEQKKTTECDVNNNNNNNMCDVDSKRKQR